MTLVYITCKDEKEAKNISMLLLNKRLIACANIFPIKSLYWWKGKIVNGRENVIIAKTNERKIGKVEHEVKKIHSYTIPCILRIGASANKEYERWAGKELR
ncbi:divalent-cation tolerance protein CutA [Candidatus Woesearchaeota archaeon]|nr:divalent-cation tolerance protein CutA [Candidatus Woesearchaeota archaeon]